MKRYGAAWRLDYNRRRARVHKPGPMLLVTRVRKPLDDSKIVHKVLQFKRKEA